MKKSNEYLYGKHKVADIPERVILSRVTRLKRELNKEQRRSSKVRNFTRVKHLKDAIQFWELINDN